MALSSGEIRRQFIDFFVQRCGHTFVPSSPVIPHDDPTLLFANAGMNQFKDVFLSVGERPYTRAANTQKCIRAGGKHNDLDDVGKDTYHHTYFEMLGNWSFGDYFKEEAIRWAWQLLTEVWGLEKDRLHATVFGGDEADGLKADDEAAELWKTVTDIDPEHIHYCGKKDNFWEMGETGPCGPCSEIHIDLTPDQSGRNLVNADDARVIEIWNLVFIQFNRDTRGTLTPLPARHVDTGMGLERVVAVLQGKDSGYDKTNYDTDLFTTLFDAIHDITGAPAYDGNPETTLKNPTDTAYRVIADHARCLTFALTDGAVPDNDGRGYVLRRILRRAFRYGRQHLGVDGPFLHKLVPVIVTQLGDVFPELKADPARVEAMVLDEEESFGKTLDRGIELFEQAAKNAGDLISGEDAFKLYDTYGFPLDLTQIMAQERGMKVDLEGFHQQMEAARARSKTTAAQDARQSLVELVQRGSYPATKFVGDSEFVASDARATELLVLEDDVYRKTDKLEVGQDAAIVVDVTPFYAEAGGQVGDTGTIHSTRGAVFRVEDTIKVGGVVFHLGRLEEGGIGSGKPPFSEGDPLLLEIDQPRRRAITTHHTSTHLMNWALREVLGEHVQQRGSLVDEQKTRFDFSNPKSLDAEQIQKVETLVNQQIADDLEVNTRIVPQEEALKINGLRAVFGEKYPPEVRVVAIGRHVKRMLKKPEKDEWRQYSVEFCGGTHLAHTAEADTFAIIGEEAVAKGVRRITAVAGELAKRCREHAQTLTERLEAIRGERPESLEQDLAALQEAMDAIPMPMIDRQRLRAEVAQLQKSLKAHQKEATKAAETHVVDAARQIAQSADDRLIVADVPGADAGSLRKAMDVIRATKPDAALLLAAAGDDKVAFVASVPEALIAQGLKAGDWVREVAQVTGGGGGGRPDMAQAGGKHPGKLSEALEKGRQFATEKLGG